MVMSIASGVRVGALSLTCLNRGQHDAAWSPLNLPNLVMWLDAPALGLADGTSVTSWTDRSGNANHAIEATNPPTYKTSIQNSLAVVRFDGSNDQLITAGNVLAGLTDDFTIYAVVANYAVAAVARPMAIGYAVTGSAIELCAYNFDNATTHSIRYEGASRTFSQVDSDPSIIAFMRDNPYTEAVIARFNGSEVLSVVAGSTDNTLGNSRVSLGVSNAGSNNFFACDLGEVVVCNSLLSAANIALLETYLNDRWAIY